MFCGYFIVDAAAGAVKGFRPALLLLKVRAYRKPLSYAELPANDFNRKEPTFGIMLLLPYNPAWPNHFKQIASILQAAVGNHLLTIHHIGSTAVPGLAAKPIIDINMEYPPEGELKAITATLKNLGYHHNGDQGIPGREVFKRKPTDALHPVLDAIPHHLYACPSDSTELNRHIQFRNGLRSDEKARIAYENIKQEVATLVRQKRKAYAEIKQVQSHELIESVLRAQP
ncbi:MAG: GrpB-like predicted nucleotidyltransferase (UPF0157 family) [Neolewinella sp.]